MTTNPRLKGLSTTPRLTTQSALISKREEGKPRVSGWPIISILGLVFHLEGSEVRITFHSTKKLILDCACNQCLQTRGEDLLLKMRTSICIGSGLRIKSVYTQHGSTPCWRTTACIRVSPMILAFFVHSIQRIRITKMKEPNGKIRVTSTFSGNTMLRTFALLLQYKNDS